MVTTLSEKQSIALFSRQVVMPAVDTTNLTIKVLRKVKM